MNNTIINVGDIVLTQFPFAESEVSKLRPAVVISLLPHDAYLVTYITSAQFNESTEFDIVLEPSVHNNLKVTSRVRVNRMTTIAHTTISRLLGILDQYDKQKIQQALHSLASSFLGHL